MAERFIEIGIGLGLGLLIGLQRERTESRLGGVRTFPLVALVGLLAGQLGVSAGSVWPVLTGALALTALVVAADFALSSRREPKSGLTTELAMLALYWIGAGLAYGRIEVAIVSGGLVAVLLQYKGTLHAFAERLSERDLRAVMQIALIALVILPALPDRSYGPYEVWNPRRIWIVVVLITFISLASYVASRLVGARAGTLLGGVLGGMISSTATTASYARRAREAPAQAGSAAVVLMIASTVVFARIFVELSAVEPRVLREVAAPLATMAGVNVALCALGFLVSGAQGVASRDAENPAELKAALVFGLLYAGVVLGVAAAKARFGSVGLYAVAAISGLTDVDAITLSTARLVGRGDVASAVGWRTILIAVLANLVFKGALAGVLGGAALVRRVAPLFAASLAAGAAILWLWP